MEILLASGNRHKQEELAQILHPHNIIIPKDRNITFDCDETGSTYMENALLKAQTLYGLTGLPVIADDSGLSVSALGGAPGVYSARYGLKELGRELDTGEKNSFLLENMKGMGEREAFFVCAMVLLMEPYRFYSVQETLKGEIAHSPCGGGGFGYDPVFYLPERGCCLAEVSAEEKNEISHRGKAGKALSFFIQNL